MKICELVSCIEAFAPLAYAESYDNPGLIAGDPDMDARGVLVTVDITEKVIEDALNGGENLIISHHPLIIEGLKKINGKTATERCIIKAIKNDIALYAAHTNLDKVHEGVSYSMCRKLGLERTEIMKPSAGGLRKLVTYVPISHAEKVRLALFDAGAGHIGDYDMCSFNLDGNGTFRGSEDTSPFAGKKGAYHTEPETRIETIFPDYGEKRIINALIKAHPYEEVAYDIYRLENTHQHTGFGMTGYCIQPYSQKDFLNFVKSVFGLKVIRHTACNGKKIKKVGVCGGSGIFLLNDAIRSGCDIFITGDVKYHQFFDAENKILIADIGHYESEKFSVEIIYELLIKNFPKFAVRLSKVITNPINYFQ
ncbi:MAG: Nif3-like dinuclear metal center hexameric protein [Bacteroidota bacterium]